MSHGSHKRPEHTAPPEMVIFYKWLSMFKLINQVYYSFMTTKKLGNTLPSMLNKIIIFTRFYVYFNTNNLSNHIIDVQHKLSERALELLAIPEDKPCFLLDIGCGSGLSGEVLSDNGHYWTGVDISRSMLEVASERETEGDLILHDMGCGLPFRAGSFDGAISISAVQWLCNADKKSHNPIRRIKRFFTTLYAVLVGCFNLRINCSF